MFKRVLLLGALVVVAFSTVSEAKSLRAFITKKCRYECPDNSMRKRGLLCYKDFGDCECDEGYYKYKGYCKEKEEKKEKYDDDDKMMEMKEEEEMEEEGEKEMEEEMEKEIEKEDKEAEKEMEEMGENLEEKEEEEDEKIMKMKIYERKMKCSYKCPVNSYHYSILRLMKRCPRGFQHCKCKLGYYKSGNTCKKLKIPIKLPFPKPFPKPYQEEKECDYECPKYSMMYTKKKCPDDYNDCKCKFGYYMYKGYCKKKLIKLPIKF